MDIRKISTWCAEFILGVTSGAFFWIFQLLVFWLHSRIPWWWLSFLLQVVNALCILGIIAIVLFSCIRSFKPAAPRKRVVINVTFLALIGFTDGKYSVELWDTVEGAMIERKYSVATNGRIIVELPEVKHDIAVKIKN